MPQRAFRHDPVDCALQFPFDNFGCKFSPPRRGSMFRLLLPVYEPRTSRSSRRWASARFAHSSNIAQHINPLFVIVSELNAINFTDGLDGLAGLISATAFAAFGGIALMQGQVFLARFCFTVVGALFGFLWFNVHPAELFMGDTGRFHWAPLWQLSR